MNDHADEETQASTETSAERTAKRKLKLRRKAEREGVSMSQLRKPSPQRKARVRKKYKQHLRDRINELEQNEQLSQEQREWLDKSKAWLARCEWYKMNDTEKVRWDWYFIQRECLDIEMRTGAKLDGVRKAIILGDLSLALSELNAATRAEHAGELAAVDGDRAARREVMMNRRTNWRCTNLTEWPMDGTNPPEEWEQHD